MTRNGEIGREIWLRYRTKKSLWKSRPTADGNEQLRANVELIMAIPEREKHLVENGYALAFGAFRLTGRPRFARKGR
jgi:hypothetical protein